MPTAPQQGNTNLQGVTGNVLSINADGSLTVVSEAGSLISGTLQSAAAANGNGTALALSGEATVVFTVNMVGFTGTVNFEGSEDGTNFDTIEIDQSSSGTIASSVTGSTTTSIHTYVASVSGLQSVRARVSSFSAGTVTVTAHAAPETFSTHAINVAQLGGVAILFMNADGQTAAQIPMDGVGLFNGTTIDRWKGDSGAARVSLQAQGTPVTGSAAVAVNTSNSAALPAVASKTNYITGFSVTTQGGTGAAAGAVTVTGPISGTLTFEVGAAANNPVVFIHTFPHPIPASAVNTAITVNVPALGANTGAAACTIYGYVQ